jgi:serine/threonine protein kinase
VNAGACSKWRLWRGKALALIDAMSSARLLQPHHDASATARYMRLGALRMTPMGPVYNGIDTVLERPVALKVLRADATDDLVERFRREARAAARLRHRSISQVYEIFEEEGRLCLVMELASGVTLARVLADGPLEPATASVLIRDAALAVDHAHERGVAHGDLAAENVLVDGDAMRILDFGIAARRPSPLPHLVRQPDIKALGGLLKRATGARLDPGSRMSTVVRRCLGEDASSLYRSAAELAADLGERA